MNVKDVRLRSLLLTLVLIVTIVSVVTYWPDPISEEATEAVTETVTVVSETEDGNSDEIKQRFNQAVEKLRKRHYLEAIEKFREVLIHAPSMPEAYLNMGFAHVELKHYKLSVESFQTAIDLRPSQVNAYWGLAVSLEGICDIAGAIGAMRTYVHLADPEEPYLKKANAALWEWDQMKADSIKNKQNIIACHQLEK